VRLAGKAVRQHIDLKTFSPGSFKKGMPASRRSDFESLKIRLQNVQDNDEVAMPETARAPENRAPNENPHAGGIDCKHNATFQKFNQKLMWA
jgi:hypothetical protein